MKIKQREIRTKTKWIKTSMEPGSKINPNDFHEVYYRFIRIGTQESTQSSTEMRTNETLKPAKNMSSETGVKTQYGYAAPITDPKANRDLDFSELRSNKDVLTVSYDCNYIWLDDSFTKRKVLSYHLSFYMPDPMYIVQVSIICKPNTPVYASTTIERILGCVLDFRLYGLDSTGKFQPNLPINCEQYVNDCINYGRDIAIQNSIESNSSTTEFYVPLIDYSNRSKKSVASDKKNRYYLPINLVYHCGLPILSCIYSKKPFFTRNISSVGKALVSLLKPSIYDVPSQKNHRKCYPVSVQFRDTLSLTANDRDTLNDLARSLNFPSLNNHDDLGILQNSLADLMDYGSSNSLIPLLYSSEMFGINKQLPATLSAVGEQFAFRKLKEEFNIESDIDFNRIYRGLKKVPRGRISTNSGSNILLENSSMEPISDDCSLLQTYATKSYYGGYNSSLEIGWFEGETYRDYDLNNAYPTCMCCIPDIDFSFDNYVLKDLQGQKISLDDFETPFDPLFANIEFRFPENVKYPNIPISYDESLVYPLTSDGIDGVYASGPDIYLALKLGAEITIKHGFMACVKKDSEGNISHSLRSTCKSLVTSRNHAKEFYGKGSVQEKLFKLVVNSIYGKIAQNIKPKKHWDLQSDKTISIKDSKISSPIHACLITAGVRCVLFSALNQLDALGFKSYSATTDGFITNAPLEILNRLDLYGFSDIFRDARLYLSDNQDGSLWSQKHQMRSFYNLASRANVAPNIDGVCAHGGWSPIYKSDSLEDRTSFLDLVLSRDGKVTSTYDESANLKTIYRKKSDFFIQKNKKKNLSTLDFDLKRKPVKSSFVSTYVTRFGSTYIGSSSKVSNSFEVACFETKPFADLREYIDMKETKNQIKSLRTQKDWDLYYHKLNNKNEAYCRHIRDLNWSILTSCIMGHRLGIWNIPGLNTGSVKDKINLINSHNNSDKLFSVNEWKNCRKPERSKQILPYKELEEKLHEFNAVICENYSITSTRGI